MNREDLQSLFEKEELLFLGVVTPEVSSDFKRYETWLKENRHGEMVYLEENKEARAGAEKILAGTQSVLVFGLPYKQSEIEGDFKFAAYSKFRDYHKLLKEKGEKLIGDLQKNYPGDYRVVVDSAPVLERALAAKTVEGFIGKNTCYIHPKFGSFLLLGEVFSSQPFPIDPELKLQGCETCTLCQVECPTGALDEDYRIDARKCLAYWTIENRGTIPFEFWPHLKDYVFGCDLCQSVCPFNKEAQNQLPKSITVKEFPSLFEIATMDQRKYEEAFGGTPATRAKREGLRRNALIALAVSKDERLDCALQFVDQDPHPVLLETRTQIKSYLVQDRLT